MGGGTPFYLSFMVNTCNVASSAKLTCPTAKYDCNDVSLVWFRECWRLVSLLLKGRIFFFWHLVSVAFERSFFHALPGIFHLFHGFRSHFSYLSPFFSMSSMRFNASHFAETMFMDFPFPHVSLNLDDTTKRTRTFRLVSNSGFRNGAYCMDLWHYPFPAPPAPAEPDPRVGPPPPTS